MTGFELEGSVGRNAANDSDDVRALRTRLVDLGYDWLDVTGTVDSELLDTIDLLQSIIAGRETVSGDGRVDVPTPEGERWLYDWLRAWNVPRWSRYQSGMTMRTPPLAVVEGGGCSGPVDAVVRGAARRYDDAYRRAADAPPMAVSFPADSFEGTIGDVGGKLSGTTVEVYPPTDDADPGPVDWQSDAYDRSAMRAVLEAVRSQPGVQSIQFGDPELADPGPCSLRSEQSDGALVRVAPLLPDRQYDRPVDDLVPTVIELFDGTSVEPTAYPETVEGFDNYLEDVGVVHGTATEMVAPYNDEVATALGYPRLLPPQRWWPRGGALALLSDRLREQVGDRIELRNWWRPVPYNERVGGAPESDHITASSVDLDFQSPADRAKGASFLDELADAEPWLAPSIGLGNVSIHVGVVSYRGARRWTYDSYPDR